jgi:hypothetical protein
MGRPPRLEPLSVNSKEGARNFGPYFVPGALERVVEGVEASDADAVRDELQAIEALHEWLALDRFDRHLVNSRLRQFAAGDERWQQGP